MNQDQRFLMDEFQLNELEERLEMTAVGSDVAASYICCECLLQPYCIPRDGA